MSGVLLVGCSEAVRRAVPADVSATLCDDWPGDTLPVDISVVVVGRRVSSPASVALAVGRDTRGGLVVCAERSEVEPLRSILKLTPFVPMSLRVVAEDDEETVRDAIRHALVRHELTRATRSALDLATSKPPPVTAARVPSTAPLLAFHRRYAAYESDVDAAVRAAASSHPSFAPIVKLEPEEGVEARRKETAERRRRALVDGEWEPYLHELRAQGAMYAKLGVSFGAWYDLLPPFRGAVVAQTAVEEGMAIFLDRSMQAIAEGYLDASGELRRHADHRARLFGSIVETSLDAIVGQSVGGVITGWNRAAEDLFGYASTDVVGRRIDLIVPEEDRASVRALVDEIVAGKGGESFETVRIARDGRELELLATASVIEDEDGVPIGVSWIMRDIAERKRKEAERAELVEQLKRSNEDLEHFAFVASHDLQEPLRMVIAHLSLLERRLAGDVDDATRTHMAHASNGAKRMKRLVGDLLEFARIDSRGQPPALCSLNAILDEACEALASVIDETGAVIDAPDLPSVHADEAQLRLVFQNLISNALKFRSSARPHVRVEVTGKPTEWLVSVSDNGIGFDPAHAERIFQMFQRLHDRGTYDGSGIGLAIVRRIVQRHGGRVWASARAEGGALVQLTLPRPARDA